MVYYPYMIFITHNPYICAPTYILTIAFIFYSFSDSPEFGQQPPGPEEHPPGGFFFSGSFPNHGDPNFRFGFAPGPGFGPPNHDDNDDDDDDDNGGRQVPFGGGFNFRGGEPFDMMRHFEEVFRNFDEMFRGFGMADFPPPCK